jgi:ribosomal protein S18 acetylase RimI-like enzyme
VSAHPLDRPIWSALTTRQAAVALGDTRALRYAPAINMLGAAADGSAESLAALAALVPMGGAVGTVEAEELPVPPGAVARKRAMLAQMLLDRIEEGAHPDFVPLGDDDAAEMLALATLTEPGPFYPRTHTLGDFVGVRLDGRLVAMAGERMKAPGFTEVSAVCTHPDFRGRGFAGGLMRVVSARILARGETPFLHSYATNAGAIALYEALGFRIRREVVFTILAA